MKISEREVEIYNYIRDWESGHKDPIPDGYANIWIHIKEIYTVLSNKHIPKEYWRRKLNHNRWKILLQADPYEFEYGGWSTSVELYERYQTLGHPDYYKVHMSTIDDRSLSLWLYADKMPPNGHRRIRDYFTELETVKSCHYTYYDLAGILDLPRNEKAPFGVYLDMDKFKEIEAHPLVQGIDFN